LSVPVYDQQSRQYAFFCAFFCIVAWHSHAHGPIGLLPSVLTSVGSGFLPMREFGAVPAEHMGQRTGNRAHCSFRIHLLWLLLIETTNPLAVSKGSLGCNGFDFFRSQEGKMVNVHIRLNESFAQAPGRTPALVPARPGAPWDRGCPGWMGRPLQAERRIRCP